MMSQNDDASLSDDMLPQETEPSQESQAIDTTSIQKTLNQHKQNLKQRRRERQEAIEVAHDARIKKLQKLCERAKARHRETVRAIQRPKLELLLRLIEQKREIQTKIDDCVSQKEAAFMGTVHKFTLAIDARSAAME
ncbi:hypothetical protein B0A55_05181 [Friedmanniomyces simplex]|uniref:Uncharacterized protein n=1 Tax=Friedmanniomyces simplex TaxID=329884 RepID=A0A4U0XGF4_9PEZI|nr:hypothetical protein B0A55_05181 [Friedmanniomyces simplex]